MNKPFVCSAPDPWTDQTGDAVQEIMERCGVKEDEQDRIWYAVFDILDRQQNIWFNRGKRFAISEGKAPAK